MHAGAQKEHLNLVQNNSLHLKNTLVYQCYVWNNTLGISAKAQEHQLNTISLGNDLGLSADNSTHLPSLSLLNILHPSHTRTHSSRFVIVSEDNTCLFTLSGLFNSSLKPI